jgi:NAD(P)-dependent dehydrogenase (short-subunit alcohol dehydrogenase family)
LVIDARGEGPLQDARTDLADSPDVVALVGDIADGQHRDTLAEAAQRLGGLDLLVNNASTLGPTPRPMLGDYPLTDLEQVYRVNVLAPLALTQLVLPQLLRSDRGAIVNITSDAAVEAYDGWGGYGSSKAALDQVTAILAAEHPQLAVYAFDPGDMRTTMQQDAFPGDDISDRAEPESVVPSLLRLVDERPPSGRYRHADLARSTRPSLAEASWT